MEWVLELRHPVLTPVMVTITALGSEVFFLAVTPLGYWLARRDAWVRVGLAFMFAAVLNATLKDLWQAPRPMLEPLVTAGGFSFPSGHAQISAAFWGWLAIELRRRWFVFAAALMVALIMASRVYLGVHWPRDVLVGAAMGGLVVATGWLFIRIGGPARLRAAGPLVAWLPALAVMLAVVWLPDPERVGLKSASALAGLWAGVLALEARPVPVLRRGVAPRLAAVLLGFAVLIAIWAGGKALLESLGAVNAATSAARYVLVGFWAAAGAPWVFHRCGWTEAPAAQRRNVAEPPSTEQSDPNRPS